MPQQPAKRSSIRRRSKARVAQSKDALNAMAVAAAAREGCERLRVLWASLERMRVVATKKQTTQCHIVEVLAIRDEIGEIGKQLKDGLECMI